VGIIGVGSGLGTIGVGYTGVGLVGFGYTGIGII